MLICQGKSCCRKKTVNPETFSGFGLWCQGLEERLVGAIDSQGGAGLGQPFANEW